MSESEPIGGKPPRSPRVLAFLPLIAFALLAAVFFFQLISGKDSSVIPSALIGMPAPETSLPPLEPTGLPGLESSAFKGKVTLVNVWASWCGPCRAEHPLLMQLAEDGRFELAGINQKDPPENATRFLASLGNPYTAIGRDNTGRAGIEWGVYGVPETFVVDADGLITFKHVGPLTEAAIADGLMPAIEEALAKAGAS